VGKVLDSNKEQKSAETTPAKPNTQTGQNQQRRSLKDMVN